MLLVHGLLHVLGMDHEEGQQQAAHMSAAEQGIMTQLGWGDRGGLIASADAGLGTAEPFSAGVTYCRHRSCLPPPPPPPEAPKRTHIQTGVPFTHNDVWTLMASLKVCRRHLHPAAASKSVYS